MKKKSPQITIFGMFISKLEKFLFIMYNSIFVSYSMFKKGKL